MTAAGTAPAVEGVRSSAGRRVRRVCRLAVVFLGLYLVMTFLNPRVVPRASFLPAPASRGVWYDTCEGRPLNRHDEQWVRDTFTWTHSEFTTLVGCMEQLEGSGRRPG